MKKRIVIVGAVVALAVFPLSTFAATYGYVNTQGMLKTIEANSAAEALVLPTDRAERSGVILMSNNTPLSATTTVILGK